MLTSCQQKKQKNEVNRHNQDMTTKMTNPLHLWNTGKWGPGANWGRSPPSCNIKQVLEKQMPIVHVSHHEEDTGETLSAYTLIYVVKYSPLWSTSIVPEGYASVNSQRLSDTKQDRTNISTKYQTGMYFIGVLTKVLLVLFKGTTVSVTGTMFLCIGLGSNPQIISFFFIF